MLHTGLANRLAYPIPMGSVPAYPEQHRERHLCGHAQEAGVDILVQSTNERVRRWTPQAGHGSTGTHVFPLLAGFVT